MLIQDNTDINIAPEEINLAELQYLTHLYCEDFASFFKDLIVFTKLQQLRVMSIIDSGFVSEANSINFEHFLTKMPQLEKIILSDLCLGEDFTLEPAFRQFKQQKKIKTEIVVKIA